MSHRVLKHLIALILLGCVAFAVYSPGLNGPFLFDDAGNFLQNPGVAMSELSWRSVVDAALSKTGVEYIHRPIPRVTFALNYYFAGERFSNLVFKTTNLVIHLLNGGAGVLVVAVAGRQFASQSHERRVDGARKRLVLVPGGGGRGVDSASAPADQCSLCGAANDQSGGYRGVAGSGDLHHRANPGDRG